MRHYHLLLFFVLAAIGCSKVAVIETSSIEATPFDVFYASFDTPTTKAQWGADDEVFKFYWTKNDTVSIFCTNTLNQSFVFSGEDGSRSGTFQKLTNDDFYVCEELPTNYAVYPYRKETVFREVKDSIIYSTLPRLQEPTGASNIMVAVTPSPEDRELKFKNACGYLFVPFFGADADKVQSVIIKGKNNEVLSGQCAIKVGVEMNPELTMLVYADSFKINCPDVYFVCVNLSNYELGDSPKVGFVLPPITFADGFTMTMVDSYGRVLSRSITGQITIERNVVNMTEPVEVVFEGDGGFAMFEDSDLEAYMLSKFDIDGDGRINSVEASVVTYLDLSSVTPTSLSGLEFFPNLSELNIVDVFAESLDLTKIKNLEKVCIGCDSNITLVNCTGLNKLLEFTHLRMPEKYFGETPRGMLENIILDGCSSLEILDCQYQKLSGSLDLSECANLREILLSGNFLTEVLLPENEVMELIYLETNQLASIDLHYYPNLYNLQLGYNKLTWVDISCVPNILHINLCRNNLPELLDFHNFPLIESLYIAGGGGVIYVDDPDYFTLYTHLRGLEISCGYNLNSINLTQNVELEALWISGASSLTTLDLSHCPNMRIVDTRDCPSLTTVYLHPDAVLDTSIWRIEDGPTIIRGEP